MVTSQPAATADLTALADALGQAAGNSTNAIEPVMDEIANEIKNRMVALAPKRTGRLASSITVLKSNNTWIIGPQGVSYAVYQEYGTGSRGEFGGTGKGMKAQPYVRPAVQEVLGDLSIKVGVAATNLIVVKGKNAKS